MQLTDIIDTQPETTPLHAIITLNYLAIATKFNETEWGVSKLNVDQKTIYDLLSAKTSDFLIPDYQRPYAWDEEQCQTLWDDIFAFAFPDNDYTRFNEDEEYFLGSIVTFKNDKGKLEVIDGQQRLTTVMLILRAFYDKFAMKQDENSRLTRERIEKCIWKTDTFGKADKNILKINSEVATDSDKEEFLELLRTGEIPQKSKSQYVSNYRYFVAQIDEMSKNFDGYLTYFAARLLANCILLPIEAESQDTALRIFSTLNDRGLPLSDADIFKAQFYKFYSDLGQKDWFIEEWKKLEDITSKIFHPTQGTPMDELFTRYMYFLRAKEGNKSTTTESLRKFYERNKHQYIKDESTIGELQSLALFWQDIAIQNKEKFSDETLKKLFVLNYAPNGMWQYITSVYFLRNKLTEDPNQWRDSLDTEKFNTFLDKITAFIFAYAVVRPGVGALRTPVFDEMVNIINGKDVTFERFRGELNETQTRPMFENYQFTNGRPITRSLLTWYAYTFEGQKLLDLDESLQIEHIFARKRQEMEKTLSSDSAVEALGNKVLLESSINIRASDFRFEDKKKIYTGEISRSRTKQQSEIAEIMDISRLDTFEESNIKERTKTIIDRFFEWLRAEQLV